MGGKQVRAAESRGLALTQGLRVSRGLGSLELTFPELSGNSNRQYPCEGVKLQAWEPRAQSRDLAKNTPTADENCPLPVRLSLSNFLSDVLCRLKRFRHQNTATRAPGVPVEAQATLSDVELMFSKYHPL